MRILITLSLLLVGRSALADQRSHLLAMDAPVQTETSAGLLEGDSYASMTREQLLRQRGRLVDQRPGGGSMALAWLGIIFGIPGGGASAVATGLLASGGPVVVVLLLIPTVVGFGMAALGIYWLVTKSSERKRLGAEIDLIDDALEHQPTTTTRPAQQLLRLASF